MNSFEWGMFVATIIGVLSWVVALEFRLRSLQAKLSEVSVEKSDLEVQSRVRDLPDSDLDADLSKNLSSKP